MVIYVCGDSTAAPYEPDHAPMTGWGQVLEKYLSGIQVVDAARGGRSTKSFLSEGRLQEIEKSLKPGDLVLIQFTHNDTSDLVWRHTDPWTSFKSNLELFVDTARVAGALPVLVTPIPRRYFRDGVLLDAHGEYPKVIRTVAMQRGVPLIDVCMQGMEEIQKMGDEESKKLYMHVAPGVYPDFPQGQTDDTHTQYAGADFYARMIADGLKKLRLV